MQIQTLPENIFPHPKYVREDYNSRPRKIVYEWTVPRMVKILRQNRQIEEEVKGNFWKFEDVFSGKKEKRAGKLMRLFVGYSYLGNKGKFLPLETGCGMKNFDGRKEGTEEKGGNDESAMNKGFKGRNRPLTAFNRGK